MNGFVLALVLLVTHLISRKKSSRDFSALRARIIGRVGAFRSKDSKSARSEEAPKILALYEGFEAIISISLKIPPKNSKSCICTLLCFHPTDILLSVG